MTRQEYRQQIKSDLERRNVVNSFVGSDVTVDEKDVRALYDERFGAMPDHAEHVHVRQILVSYGQHTSRDADAACQLVSRARERVRAGESFVEVAKEISEVAPSQGGDIGWLPTDQLASWMSDALEGLEAGDVSEVVTLPFGCSLLEVVELREIERMTFDQARPMLRQEIFNRGLEEAYRAWMEKQRERTYIDRRGYFAAAARFGESTFGVEPSAEPDQP
jgi:parvulin-like peptidyl-prolyl isomerase